MLQDRDQRIEEISQFSFKLDPEERTSFIDEACGDDVELKSAVKERLEQYKRAKEYFGDLAERLGMRGLADAKFSVFEGQEFGKYKIEKHIGQGGMGMVYKAVDSQLERSVALKFLSARYVEDDHANERFIREARAAAALNHPNILTVHDIIDYNGLSVIVMEYIEGETLRQKLKRGSLDIDRALDYTKQIASGLAVAHEKGIVHRDLKPTNIMVTERGDVKILDFGLAKLRDASLLTKEGTTMGTVAYMSPEQARGNEADNRSDIWSLGVIVYEMLTGERPFKGAYEQAMMYSIVSEEPIPLTNLLEEIPLEVANSVQKMLSKERQGRYDSMDSLLNGLGSLGGESETSRQHVKINWSSLSSYRKVPFYGILMALLFALMSVGYILTKWGRGDKDSMAVSLQTHPVIAVLPIESRSGMEEQVYITEGMTDELIATLASVEGIRVASRQSVNHFSQVEQSLGNLAKLMQADYFVDGTMLWAGDQVRITINLIEPVTETALWGQSFVGLQQDVLELQQEVALNLIKQLKIQITPEDEAQLQQIRKVDPKAYELYHRGLHVDRQGGLGDFKARLEQSIHYFTLAVAIDSNYADAYTALGDATMWYGKYTGLSKKESFEKAREYLDKALDLYEANTNALIVKSILLQSSRHWAEGEEVIRQAIELESGNLRAHVQLGALLIRTGRPEAAVEVAQEILQIEPVSSIGHRVLADAYLYSGDYDMAIEIGKKRGVLYPGSEREILGLAYLGKGLLTAAHDSFDELITTDSSDTYLGLLGHIKALMGKQNEAEQILERLEARNARHGVAEIYVGLGEYEQALDWLEEHPDAYDFIKVWLPFTSLHSEPRFQERLHDMNLGKDLI